MIRVSILLLMLAGLPACFRPDTRETVLELPGVTRPEELRALRAHLLERYGDTSAARPVLVSVETRADPSRLLVEYHPSAAGTRNIEDFLHRHGYAVNDLKGDPGKRAAFRGNTLFR